MKFARLAITAFAISLVVSVFVTTRQVSGQVLSNQPAAGQAGGVVAQSASYGAQYSPDGRLLWSSAAPDPELAKLLSDGASIEQEAASLVEEYSRTEDEGQRAKIKAKLSGALEKQFDIQQKRRDLEVVRIETQLKKLRELMRKRSEARKTIIERRLDQLLQEADGLGWTAPPGASSSRSGFFTQHNRP